MATGDPWIVGERRHPWCNYHSVRQDGLYHFPRHLAFQGLEGGKNREGFVSLRGQEGDATYAKRGIGLMVSPRLYQSRVSPTS